MFQAASLSKQASTTPQDQPGFMISPAVEADLPDVITLFTLYAESLHIDLSFQSFAEELAGLPGKYAPPTGQILIARRRAPSNAVALANGDNSKESKDEDSAYATSDAIDPPDAIGCVAVRPISFSTDFAFGRKGRKKCEMKRLYTLPSTRGQGVGRALIDDVLKVAEELGYDEMYLDTLPTMTAALKMYEKFGFVRTEPYYHNPNEGVVFLVKRFGQ